jgi:uncharacterized protein
VKEPVVSDSTCLIGLERIGELNILPALFEPVMIPPEVEREFGNKFSWLTTEKLSGNVLATALHLVVDAGEAEAIALASEKNCLLIVDDKQARTAAKRIGISVIGTIGVLLRAKKNGVVSVIRPIMDDLELNNFFIGRALREEALKIAGE